MTQLPLREEELESRLVWIFGSPRTGSTWLLELLAHPLSLEARSQLGFRAPDDLARPLDVLPINESLLPTHIMMPAPGALATRTPTRIRVMEDVFGELAGYFFSEQFEDVWRPAVRKLAHARFHAHLERAAATYQFDERAIIVIKEPNGSHAAPAIMSIQEPARMIFLHRDGRDVVDSLLTMNAPGGMIAAWRGTAAETPEQRLALIREESLNWVARTTATERAFQERPPELRWRVSYEELMDDTPGRIGAMMGWLGLERDPAAIAEVIDAHAFGSPGQSSSGAAATRRAATPGLWRQNLSQDESALAHEIMGTKLAELGYDVATEAGAQP